MCVRLCAGAIRSGLETLMNVVKKPKIIELKSSSVGQRTKWDRKTREKRKKKVWVARLILIDDTGSKKELTKEFARHKDADDHITRETEKFKRSSGQEILAAKMTFGDLAAYYLERFATEAQYIDGRKVAGLRSIAPVRGYVDTLSKRFGNRKLNSIRYSDIHDFQIQRLNTPVTKRIKTKTTLTENERKASQTRKRYRIEYKELSTPRQIATVNRELMALRRMLNIAVMEGWISQNPFKSGPSLINMSNERMRSRILSVDEEIKLIEVCDCPERRHLKSLIICLLDTGVRLNEAVTLTWENVDLDEDFIHILAFNSKTATPRTVAISKRLRAEFDRLWAEAKFISPDETKLKSKRVFRVTNNVNRSWRTARRLAGLNDLRIHDLRHTFGTRLDRSGFTQAQIARSLGHKQVHTTFRYTNPDQELLHDIRSAVEAFHIPKTKDKQQ